VVGGHVDRALDESCGAHGWQWQQQSATPKRHRHATLTCTQAAAILAALPPGTRGGHVLRHALAKLRRAAASADE
jgi:hypothetical protein